MFRDMLCLSCKMFEFAFLSDERGSVASSLQITLGSYKMSAGCREKRIGSQRT